MSRPSLPALICALPVATLVAGCTLQGGRDTDRRYEDLRGLVLQHSRDVAELRREQESVRAAIDQMQYGRRSAGRPVYGPTGGPGAASDDYWQRATPPPTDASVTAPPSGASLPPPVAAPGAGSEPERGAVPSDLAGSAYDSAMRQLNSGDQAGSDAKPGVGTSRSLWPVRSME